MPTGSRPHGRGCCPRGRARPMPRGWISTTGLSTGCSRVVLNPPPRSTTGNCRNRWPTRAAGATPTCRTGSPISPTPSCRGSATGSGRPPPSTNHGAWHGSAISKGTTRRGCATSASRAMHHVLKSHGASIEVMRGLGMTNLGAVVNLEWSKPASDSPEDIEAAARHDAIYNRFFLGGLFHGGYPEKALEGIAPHLPEGWQDDFALIQTPLDWIGVNYYTRKRLRAADGPWPGYADAGTVLPTTQMGWEIYPDGLRDFLLRVAREYSGDLPIHVTENGMANADMPDRPDSERIAYLKSHLNAVREAIAAGAPVAGYFVWSLMDNYEWALGYEKRFGLVHVDFESLARTPKASYQALARWWRDASS